MTLAFVYPGQGSQSQGMQADLAEKFPEVRKTWEEAGDVLGYDLWAVVRDGSAEQLAQTTVTQPAMLAAGVAAYRAWQAAGGATPSQMSGHSLGEYSALVCAGAVEFADAMKVVARRAELMQGAVPAGEGAMAAILGLDDAIVVDICETATGEGVAEPVNFNSPGQVVIAGSKKNVDKAVELAKEKGARRALVLPVSVPAHSSLMQPAGEALAETLAATDFSNPDVAVICAATGAPYGDGEDIRQTLSRQVYSAVLWVQTVRAMIDLGATRIVECGPGKVLAGLIKRIERGVPVETLDDVATLEKALEG